MQGRLKEEREKVMPEMDVGWGMKIASHAIKGILKKVPWIVFMSAEVDAWLKSLDEASQDAVAADVRVLEEIGPQLGRPYVDTLADSRYANLKELRTHFGHHHYRIAFAFDPKRQAILLLGGDKTGTNQRRFYKDLIKGAEAILDRYLAQLAKQQAKESKP